MKYKVKAKVRCLGVNLNPDDILEECIDDDIIIELQRFKDKYIEIFKEPDKWKSTKHIHFLNIKGITHKLEEIVHLNISNDFI